jgi:hypothetical protein
VVAEIERLRRQRWTGRQTAAETDVSPATVSPVLRRLGLNKLSALEPAEPIRRYERECPGDPIHLDIKKLGRIGSLGHRITRRYPGAVNRHHGIGRSSDTARSVKFLWLRGVRPVVAPTHKISRHLRFTASVLIPRRSEIILAGQLISPFPLMSKKSLS